jgi:hypothetical protein
VKNASLANTIIRPLEQFFLETVSRTLPGTTTPSGVAYAEKVAPFLAGENQKDGKKQPFTADYPGFAKGSAEASTDGTDNSDSQETKR